MKHTCCDTSFLISLYSDDPNSKRARLFAASLKSPITISGLNQFELEQAVNSLVWRKTVPFGEGLQIKMDFTSDIADGSVVQVPCNFATVFTQASRLSAKYTPAGGYRSLDILHVAVALELRAGLFLSFDIKQRKLAQAEGLKLNP